MTLLLNSVITAVRDGTKGSSGFITDAQAGAAGAAMDLNIDETEQFIESELVPLWIKTLPYQSESLSMSIEEFTQLPDDDRTAYEAKIDRLINYYDQALADTDRWFTLNDVDPQGGQVFFLSLAQLP